MTSNYRILFLSSSLSNGGAERQLTLLMKYLPSNWRCKIWSMDTGPFFRVIQEMGFETSIDKRKFRYDITPFFRLWNLIRTERPNVVHSWGWMSVLAAIPACKAHNIPLVDCTIRSGMKPSRASVLVSSGADRIIANSQAGLKSSGINPSRVRVVYNGFDPERLKSCQFENDSPTGPFTVVMTGRMVREKDYAAYLSAARLFSQRNLNNWQFWAIGNGANRSTLLSSSNDLIMRGHLAFPEAGIEVLNFVRQSTVGVLMTNPLYHAEGCSNSIMEYMACGLPVICSKSGGNEELVVDGETGFLINPGDAGALVERLTYLYDNPDIAQKMGKAGKERLLKEFSVERMVNGMVSVYQEVLKN
jgi:glycosyltransferase involved in cell wall biosynthesis